MSCSGIPVVVAYDERSLLRGALQANFESIIWDIEGSTSAECPYLPQMSRRGRF